MVIVTNDILAIFLLGTAIAYMILRSINQEISESVMIMNNDKIIIKEKVK